MTSTEKRFWSYVDSSGGPDACWPWKACRSSKGYGRFNADRKPTLAHRLVLQFTVGPANGLHALHSCDNPGCCNPKHLRYGTDLENRADALSRGRIRKGSEHGCAKLTQELVIEIRRRREAGEKKGPLAEEFGISPQHVCSLWKQRTWKHLEVAA